MMILKKITNCNILCLYLILKDDLICSTEHEVNYSKRGMLNFDVVAFSI